MLGPPARSPVIVRGERHSHAEASSASRLVLVVSVAGYIIVYGERHSNAWASSALFS